MNTKTKGAKTTDEAAISVEIAGAKKRLEDFCASHPQFNAKWVKEKIRAAASDASKVAEYAVYLELDPEYIKNAREAREAASA